jgi:protein-tyrosine phosphatase
MMPYSGIKAFIYRQMDERYGSRRGFLHTYWHRLLYLLGRYGKYRQIDWSAVERVVFVCKGNICRSAFAEAVARSLGIEAISCGLHTIMDAPANGDAIRVAHEIGYDLEEHKTTPIMYLVLKRTDLLVAMEPWHAVFLGRHLYREHYRTLLGLWLRPALPCVPDPYGRSPAYYRTCFTHIEKSVNEISAQLEKARRS